MSEFVTARPRILVMGVYLLDADHHLEHIQDELSRACGYEVEQKWIALGNDTLRQPLAGTVATIREPTPKFELLNKILAGLDLSRYEYVIVCDDDVLLPVGFIDNYLALVSRYGFALSQPARTHNSYIDHPFVEQMDGLNARCTRFVEIGPVFCLARDVFDDFLPFDESASMGWGVDFIWPLLVEAAGKKMGIVDATPVEHSLRKPVQHYDWHTADRRMRDLLAEREHLSRSQAFTIVESYAD